MKVYKASDVKLTVGGVEFTSASVSFARHAEEVDSVLAKGVLGDGHTRATNGSGVALSKLHDEAREKLVYEVSFVTVIEGFDYDRFVALFFPPPRPPPRPPPVPHEPWRPSAETLLRRAGYGGRTGRSALRRLLARPDAEWKEMLASTRVDAPGPDL